jgi:hypothetical protein
MVKQKKTDNKELKIIIVLLVLLIVSWGFLYWAWNKKQQVQTDEKEIESGLRVKKLERDLSQVTLKLKLSAAKYDSISKLIINNNRGQNKIAKRNETTHKHIDNLSNSESYLLFTRNAAEYRSNPERFRVEHFR